MSDTNNNERQRIIFLHDIPDEDALALSTQHKNVIIFSDFEEVTRDKVNDDIEINNEYEPINPIIGAHIYKAGVKYSVIRGINPNFNKVEIDNNTISLRLDQHGLLRLIKTPIVEGYFYVGYDNPLRYMQRMPGTNDYDITDERNILDINDIDYSTLRQSMNKFIHFDELGNMIKRTQSGYNYTHYVNLNNRNAYILFPAVYIRSIVISNTIQNISNSYIFDLLSDPNFTNEEIQIGGVDYILVKTVMTCDEIIIYYVNL